MHTVWGGLTATCFAVAENGFMGMGIGAAMTGLRPIVEGMNMGFLLLAYNQISNNAGMLHYTSGGQYKVGGPKRGSAGWPRSRAALTYSMKLWRLPTLVTLWRPIAVLTLLH